MFNKFINSKGQVNMTVAGVTAVVTFAGSWLGSYILNSPKEATAALYNVRTDVVEVKNRLNSLCNDYGQTVSRLDQNMQNIGRALKVDIVVGKANLDPCK